MASPYEDLIKSAYTAFNTRNINEALVLMHPEVQWPKAFEGGYVAGHHAVKAYWSRQWTEINPNVEPTGFYERPNGSLEVAVHQKVKDLEDQVVFDGTVKHIYTFEEGLIKTMVVELT